MRLQHDRGRILYLDPLQTAILIPLTFGFRNATENLRPTASAEPARPAIGMSNGGNCQSAEEHKGCGYYE